MLKAELTKTEVSGEWYLSEKLQWTVKKRQHHTMSLLDA